MTTQPHNWHINCPPSSDMLKKQAYTYRCSYNARALASTLTSWMTGHRTATPTAGTQCLLTQEPGIPPTSKWDRRLFGAGFYSSKYGTSKDWFVRVALKYSRYDWQKQPHSHRTKPRMFSAMLMPWKIDCSPLAIMPHPLDWVCMCAVTIRGKVLIFCWAPAVATIRGMASKYGIYTIHNRTSNPINYIFQYNIHQSSHSFFLNE